eukprot:scaffold3451_cov109-Cylindrotheca_fusiformis.AAC.1
MEEVGDAGNAFILLVANMTVRIIKPEGLLSETSELEGHIDGHNIFTVLFLRSVGSVIMDESSQTPTQSSSFENPFSDPQLEPRPLAPSITSTTAIHVKAIINPPQKSSAPPFMDITLRDNWVTWLQKNKDNLMVGGETCLQRNESFPGTSRPVKSNDKIHHGREDDVSCSKSHQGDQWQEQFDKLVKFQALHGHCNVSINFQEDSKLARWVKRQRYQYKLYKGNRKSSNMSIRRIRLLESIGFVWELQAAAWHRKFNELLKFKEKTGHCEINTRSHQDTKKSNLATWVKCQRRQYKLLRSGKPSSMTIDRIEALNSIGFQWSCDP